ncbi:hypothetical protein RIF29_38373 [Crotalaria pallida]|uniref:Uncharacterized protein n=1 Tax=Crotalaria pallida TaxID=3830 RepID=A0AAN9HLG6_CROPI
MARELRYLEDQYLTLELYIALRIDNLLIGILHQGCYWFLFASTFFDACLSSSSWRRVICPELKPLKLNTPKTDHIQGGK